MIVVKNTPNNMGVAVYGDYLDLKNLYDALQEVVGEEDEFIAYSAARVSDVSYGSRKECVLALNDFIRLYAAQKSKKNYDIMLSKENIWDHSLVNVRAFQGAIAKCIKETVPTTSLSSMMNLMHKDYTWFDRYTWQYLDILNYRFIEMDYEKRLKNIPILAKRLAERGEEYNQIRERDSHGRKEVQYTCRSY